jgi:hypothetical protein
MVGLIVLFSIARSQPLSLAVDPNLSSLTFSIQIPSLGTGYSATAHFGGTILADIGAQSITFLPQSVLNGIDNGNYAPGPGGAPGTAPGHLGGETSLGGLGGVQFAARETATQVSGNASITSTVTSGSQRSFTFDPTSLFVGAVGGRVDYRGTGILGGLLGGGSINYTDFVPLSLNSSAPSGTLVETTSGTMKNQTLTLPIQISQTIPISGDIPIELTASVSGQIIAVANQSTRTHILAIGVRDPDTAEHPIRGDVAAARVAETFSEFYSISSVHLLQLQREDTGNKSQVIGAIEDLKSKVEPGDNAIVYLAAHGGFRNEGSEQEVLAQYSLDDRDLRRPTTGDEYLVLGDGVIPLTRDILQDDELASLFSGDDWDLVNKLFLIDSCYGGGFWGSGSNMDLGLLPRSGLVASASEPNFGFGFPIDGMFVNELSVNLTDALTNVPRLESIDFDLLFNEIVASRLERREELGWLLPFDLRRYGVLLSEFDPSTNWDNLVDLAAENSLSAFATRTTDLEWQITPVPEAKSMCLATLGMLCLSRGAFRSSMGRG